MKGLVLAVSLLALACFAVATEQTAGVAVSSAEGVELGNAPFVPQAVDADADVDEVDEEDEDEADIDEADENENESEDEDEDEADQEDSDSDSDEAEEEDGGEFSFLEAMADATATTGTTTGTTSDAENTAVATAATGEHADADARPLRAPRPNAFKFHPERVVAQTSKNEDPEMGKLNLALEAVKEDILATNKQITDERKWVIAVAKIIASYNDKMKRVEAHIIALRKEMKKLYRKKKQIENLKLQKALEAKLKEARDELATLTSSLTHVQKKQGELNKSGRDLKETIAGIQAQLAKLRGQQMRKPKPAPKKRCKKGLRYSKKAKKCVPAKKKGKLLLGRKKF